MMGDVVTGKVETESMMQQSPGICKVLAGKREQGNEKGNGCPLGEEGTRAIIYHVYRCSAGQSFIKKQAMK